MRTHCKNIHITGAIGPVGKKATRRLAYHLHTQLSREEITQGMVVEFGPGTGNITDLLVQEAWGKIVCFEVLEEFACLLQNKYMDNTNIDIINKSAVSVLQHVKEGSVSGIITTIPLSFLGDEASIIFHNAYQVLKPGGILVMGQVRSKQSVLVEKIIGKKIFSERIWGLQPILITIYRKAL